METTSNNQDIYDKLLAEAKTLTNTHKLRDLRDSITSHIHSLENAAVQAKTPQYVAKYEGKFIVMFGRHYTMMSSSINPRVMNIMKVDSVSAGTSGTLYLSGDLVNIQLNEDIAGSLDHISQSVKITCGHEDRKIVQPEDIDKVLPYSEVQAYFKDAQNAVTNIFGIWDKKEEEK